MKTPNQRSAFAHANLCTYVQNQSIPQSIPHIPAFAKKHPVNSPDGGIFNQYIDDLRDRFALPLAPAYRPDGTLQTCAEVGE